MTGQFAANLHSAGPFLRTATVVRRVQACGAFASTGAALARCTRISGPPGSYLCLVLLQGIVAGMRAMTIRLSDRDAAWLAAYARERKTSLSAALRLAVLELRRGDAAEQRVETLAARVLDGLAKAPASRALSMIEITEIANQLAHALAQDRDAMTLLAQAIGRAERESRAIDHRR